MLKENCRTTTSWWKLHFWREQFSNFCSPAKYWWICTEYTYTKWHLSVGFLINYYVFYIADFGIFSQCAFNQNLQQNTRNCVLYIRKAISIHFQIVQSCFIVCNHRSIGRKWCTFCIVLFHNSHGHYNRQIVGELHLQLTHIKLKIRKKDTFFDRTESRKFFLDTFIVTCIELAEDGTSFQVTGKRYRTVDTELQQTWRHSNAKQYTMEFIYI